MVTPQLLLAAPQAAGGYLSPASLYNSLGRWMSTTQVNSSVTLNNVFPDVTGPQNASDQVDYQCLFVYNPDPSSSMVNVYAWIPSSSVVGALGWAVGADTTVASPYNSSFAPQAGYISSPLVAPSTVTGWAQPSATVAGGVQLNPVAPGMVTAFWVQRTATGSPAFAGAQCQVLVTFDILGS